MNEEQIKSALADIIGKIVLGRTASRAASEAAAAIYEQVKPKPLVWKHPSGGDHRKGECFHARTDLHHHAVHNLRGGWWYNVTSETYPTIEAAQAAAQSHADAVHWANTALADMIGGAE